MEKIKEAESYIVTVPSLPAKIFKSNSLKSHREALTLPQLLKKSVELFPNHAALKFKENDSEKWSVITYKDYKSRAEKIAKCFIKLGLREFESVAVLAFNCPEWFIAELAVIHCG
jgi:long-chain-fatty-acid--CoA ligase ACSBG